MSENNNEKEIKKDWSMKELGEIDQNNLLGFFALLLKVDRRINPHLYGNIGNTSNTNQAE
ncbi:MAG: hypothetical protein O3A36_03230 [bacterium]|nr:hypothetical protein [bacterium]